MNQNQTINPTRIGCRAVYQGPRPGVSALAPVEKLATEPAKQTATKLTKCKRLKNLHIQCTNVFINYTNFGTDCFSQYLQNRCHMHQGDIESSTMIYLSSIMNLTTIGL